MFNSNFLSEIPNKIREIIQNSPAGDLEKNINALLKSTFTKMELISREEFDIQTEVLRNTREKLEKLEIKQAALEALISKANNNKL